MVNVQRVDIDFQMWTIQDFFSESLVNQLLEDSACFNFFKIQKDRTSRPDRIYLNHYDTPSFQTVCEIFDDIKLKEFFSELSGHDFTKLKSRVELCMDSKGSWLEDHYDDVAKRTTMQIFLSDAPVSTSFGFAPTVARKNHGWVFVNTGTEKHGLPPLEFDRTSIILNWVDENWRDRSVLV